MLIAKVEQDLLNTSSFDLSVPVPRLFRGTENIKLCYICCQYPVAIIGAYAREQ